MIQMNHLSFLFSLQQCLLFKLTVCFVGINTAATNVKSDHVC